jgi:hypothetical protein
MSPPSSACCIEPVPLSSHWASGPPVETAPPSSPSASGRFVDLSNRQHASSLRSPNLGGIPFPQLESGEPAENPFIEFPLTPRKRASRVKTRGGAPPADPRVVAQQRWDWVVKRTETSWMSRKASPHCPAPVDFEPTATARGPHEVPHIASHLHSPTWTSSHSPDGEAQKAFAISHKFATLLLKRHEGRQRNPGSNIDSRLDLPRRRTSPSPLAQSSEWETTPFAP